MSLRELPFNDMMAQVSKKLINYDREILTNEKQKLKEIEEKYQKKHEEIVQKYQQAYAANEQKKQEIKKAEAVAQQKESEDADSLLDLI